MDDLDSSKGIDVLMTPIEFQINESLTFAQDLSVKSSSISNEEMAFHDEILRQAAASTTLQSVPLFGSRHDAKMSMIRFLSERLTEARGRMTAAAERGRAAIDDRSKLGETDEEPSAQASVMLDSERTPQALGLRHASSSSPSSKAEFQQALSDSILELIAPLVQEWRAVELDRGSSPHQVATQQAAYQPRAYAQTQRNKTAVKMALVDLGRVELLWSKIGGTKAQADAKDSEFMRFYDALQRSMTLAHFSWSDELVIFHGKGDHVNARGDVPVSARSVAFDIARNTVDILYSTDAAHSQPIERLSPLVVGSAPILSDMSTGAGKVSRVLVAAGFFLSMSVLSVLVGTMPALAATAVSSVADLKFISDGIGAGMMVGLIMGMIFGALPPSNPTKQFKYALMATMLGAFLGGMLGSAGSPFFDVIARWLIKGIGGGMAAGIVVSGLYGAIYSPKTAVEYVIITSIAGGIFGIIVAFAAL